VQVLTPGRQPARNLQVEWLSPELSDEPVRLYKEGASHHGRTKPL